MPSRDLYKRRYSRDSIYKNKLDGMIGVLCCLGSIFLGLVPMMIYDAQEIFFAGAALTIFTNVYESGRLLFDNIGKETRERVIAAIVILVFDFFLECAAAMFKLEGPTRTLINTLTIMLIVISQLSYRIYEFRML